MSVNNAHAGLAIHYLPRSRYPAGTEGGREPLVSNSVVRVNSFPEPCFARRDSMTPADIQILVDSIRHGRAPWETMGGYLKGGMINSPPGTLVLFIPHWLLLLAVVLPWSGLLLWRARRIRRAGLMQGSDLA